MVSDQASLFTHPVGGLLHTVEVLLLTVRLSVQMHPPSVNKKKASIVSPKPKLQL